jgi:hypothetical protein
MGHIINANTFRVQQRPPWKSEWFSDSKNYGFVIQQDLFLKDFIRRFFKRYKILAYDIHIFREGICLNIRVKLRYSVRRLSHRLSLYFRRGNREIIQKFEDRRAMRISYIHWRRRRFGRKYEKYDIQLDKRMRRALLRRRAKQRFLSNARCWRIKVRNFSEKSGHSVKLRFFRWIERIPLNRRDLKLRLTFFRRSLSLSTVRSELLITLASLLGVRLNLIRLSFTKRVRIRVLYPRKRRIRRRRYIRQVPQREPDRTPSAQIFLRRLCIRVLREQNLSFFELFFRRKSRRYKGLSPFLLKDLALLLKSFFEQAWMSGHINGLCLVLSGRLKKATRSRKTVFRFGQMPFSNISSHIRYHEFCVLTRRGCLGVKIWICFRKRLKFFKYYHIES